MNLEQHYDELCAKRDAVNAQNAPLEAELERANAQAEAARVKAMALAAQIDANRGGRAWIDMKRDIRMLAPAIERARAARAQAAEV
jgi:uncharacterized coiled-coil DUF342 family protein